jgi:hypothetical protein
MATEWAVKNVAEIKSAPRRPTLLQFTERQWQQSLRGAEETNVLPKRGVGLLFIPDPDGGGIGQPFCHDQGPETICAVMPTFKGGTLQYECRCKSRGGAGTPGRPTPEPATGQCLLGITSGRVICVKATCTGTCGLVLSSKKLFGRELFVVSCRCS